MIKRIILFCIFIFSSLFPLFPIELGNPDWEIVADGMSVSKPVQTSWGYVTVTDGRTLIGWTESGKKCFQRKLQRKPSELLCADYADFIWSVSYDRMYLSQFNPDGIFQWEVRLPSRCAAAELIPGKDGRLFVPLADSVLCVDMNGKTVWTCQISDNPLSTLKQLEDGSLICNGTIHLSPFGEILDDGVTGIPDEFISSSLLIPSSTCNFRISSSTKNSSITALDFDGTELWSKSFAPEKVIHYEITDRTIMTLSESWVIAGYVYNSSPIKQVSPEPPSERIYSESYGSSDQEQEYLMMVQGLKKLSAKGNQLSVNPVQRNVVYDLRYLNQAESSGFDFSALLSEIIMNETDSGILETAISVAAHIGRDPDNLIFKAIETKLKLHTSFQLDTSMYARCCDTLYAICAKSGTDERLLRALEIITPLISNNYQTLVRDHASETVEQLILLQINRMQQ